MTTTDTTTKPLTKLQRDVLAGIAAGEVRRISGTQARYEIVWYRAAGHDLGDHGGLVRTRRPTRTVNQFVEADLVAFSNNGTALLTRSGMKLLA